MHTAADGYATLCCDINTDESLNEARGLLLQFGVTLNVWITVGNAVLQGFYLSIHANLGSWQSRYAHFHFDELHAALRFGECCHLFHLADGGFGKVLNTQFGNQPIYYLFLDWGRFHFVHCCVLRYIIT